MVMGLFTHTNGKRGFFNLETWCHIRCHPYVLHSTSLVRTLELHKYIYSRVLPRAHGWFTAQGCSRYGRPIGKVTLNSEFNWLHNTKITRFMATGLSWVTTQSCGVLFLHRLPNFLGDLTFCQIVVQDLARVSNDPCWKPGQIYALYHDQLSPALHLCTIVTIDRLHAAEQLWRAELAYFE